MSQHIFIDLFNIKKGSKREKDICKKNFIFLFHIHGMVGFAIQYTYKKSLDKKCTTTQLRERSVQIHFREKSVTLQNIVSGL